jgi:hypothetical protein
LHLLRGLFILLFTQRILRDFPDDLSLGMDLASSIAVKATRSSACPIEDFDDLCEDPEKTLALINRILADFEAFEVQPDYAAWSEFRESGPSCQSALISVWKGLLTQVAGILFWGEKTFSPLRHLRIYVESRSLYFAKV